MKKLVVVLLTLTCLSAAVFADVTPLAISGSLETGGAYVAVKGGTAMWNAYDNDSGHAARATLGIAFTAADGNWGLITRLDTEGIVGTPGAQGATGNMIVGLDRAVLWGNVMSGMLTLKAGVLDEEAFATENEGWGNYLDGGLGLEVLVKPMAGLTIGYMVPLAPGGDIKSVLTAATGNSGNLAGNGTAVDAFSASSFLLAYQMPNLANIVVGYLNGTVGVNGTIPEQSGKVWAGFSLKAVPNLLARLEVQDANIGNKPAGDTTILEEVAYTMGPLVVDLAMYQDLYSVSGAKIAYNFRPNVAYNMGVATVGIGLDYGTENGNNWGVVGLTGASHAQAGTTASNLGIWPFVTIPFGKNQINIAAVYAISDLSNSSTDGNSGYAVFVDYRVFF